MKTKRRQFLKQTSLTSIGMLGSGLPLLGSPDASLPSPFSIFQKMQPSNKSLIGSYGPWAAGLIDKKLPSLSFRNKTFTNVDTWRKTAVKKLVERLSIPGTGSLPKINLKKQYTYDGLHIEEFTWQLPYGPATEAILLKPANANKPLPGVLAFHDHGGNKYFGTRKITKTSDNQHPMMVTHQQAYYEGKAWGNELAKQGYVVLVSDAFPFASRRVLLRDVPDHLRHDLTDENPEDPQNIAAYNTWASAHEHIMAKSLFCAGTTWPGVFFAEDRVALDIICARPDVDKNRVGCAGLSGGGMRTVFLAGLDARIKCAIPVGFMTTWKDLILNKSYTHTWMTYVPLLPNELDFPEILGLRAPLPTLVLNDIEDNLFTLSEMESADKILQAVFKKANAADKYKCSFHPGPHKFDKKMQEEAFGWFDKWLK